MSAVASSLLLAAEEPGTLLLVAIIVGVIIGSFFLCYFALIAPSQRARQIKQQGAEFEFKYDNTGPIRRYAAAGGGYLPTEISMLGEPRYIHQYESFAQQCHLGWLFGSGADKHPTYISYDTALVVVTPEAFTVIPWNEITEFLHPTGFKVSSGQRFLLTNDFTNYYPLYLKFQNEILASQLPRALATIEKGGQWLFEPFTEPTAGSGFLAALGAPQLSSPVAIGTPGIRYGKTALAWSEVGSIHVTRHLQNGALCRTTLSVRKNWGLFSAMEFDFSTLANSFLLLELLPYVCPAHLLVPAGSQGTN
jgi:hypothetical protein